MSEEKIIKEVESLLKKDEKARESKEYAYFQLLKRMGFEVFINIDEICDIPKIESVTRAIRFIQNNEGKYRPSEKTEENRKEKEKEIKSLYSKYPTACKYIKASD